MVQPIIHYSFAESPSWDFIRKKLEGAGERVMVENNGILSLRGLRWFHRAQGGMFLFLLFVRLCLVSYPPLG